MIITKRIIHFFFFLGCSLWLSGQDPVFSQFYNAPANVNPGLTGSTETPIIAINYRNQWPSIQKAYSTYSISYDQFFNQYKSGLGFSILADNAGDGAMKTINATIKYSYSVRLSGDYHLKLGMEAGIVQTSVDWQKFIFSDNLHPQYGAISPGGTKYPTLESEPTNPTRNNLDLSTGLLLHGNRSYIGLSFKHFNNPDFVFTKHSNRVQNVGIPMRWTIHGGTTFMLKEAYLQKEATFVSPYILMSVQGDFLQVNTGVYAQLSQLILGLSSRYAYRNFDAIILSAGWKYDRYKFVYSFDAPVTEIGFSSGGAHELGIIINLDKIKSNNSRSSVECFELFN